MEASESSEKETVKRDTKKVLLVTDGFFHPTFLGRWALHQSLASPVPAEASEQKGRVRENFSFSHISSLEKLPFNLASFSALVLHYHHKTISSFALGKLNTFVKKGGGILAIHAATASFQETLPYFEILGGRFIGHGPIENFEVKRIRDDIFGGIEDFIVKDELYIHELQPNIEVHFTAKHEGQEIPVVWTHRYGKGKVCYAVPGHTTESMRNKTYQQLLKRGLMWAVE
jgi:type 1 glutamine amidotransferase